AREAKRYTSWTDPNVEYEDRLLAFVESALNDRAFLDELEAFVAPLIEPGRINSLTQTLLKLTAPGVPDIYQGCELWDLPRRSRQSPRSRLLRARGGSRHARAAAR